MENVLDPLMLQFENGEASFFQGYTNVRSVVKPASTPLETILECKLVKVTTAKSRKEAKARTVADEAGAPVDRRRRCGPSRRAK